MGAVALAVALAMLFVIPKVDHHEDDSNEGNGDNHVDNSNEIMSEGNLESKVESSSVGVISYRKARQLIFSQFWDSFLNSSEILEIKNEYLFIDNGFKKMK